MKLLGIAAHFMREIDRIVLPLAVVTSISVAVIFAGPDGVSAAWPITVGISALICWLLAKSIPLT
jgi:hypothetical protein